MIGLWTQLKGFIYRLVIKILQFLRWFFRSIFYIIGWILNSIRQFFLKIKDTLFHVIMLVFVSLCAHFLIFGHCGCIGNWVTDLVRKIVTKTRQFCRFILPFRGTVRPFSGPGYMLGNRPVYHSASCRVSYHGALAQDV